MSSESPAQKQPTKNFQETVADAILSGNLDAFKKCCVGKNDINRRLLPHKTLEYKPRNNPNEHYIAIRGPTMLMYAILNEQVEIVDYILENRSPDLSIYVDGYMAIHLAALIKDPMPLKSLIKYDYTQQNIDAPVTLPGTNAPEGCKTTALHIAVSNRRYANVFLLLQDFPLPVPVPKPQPLRQPKFGAKAAESKTEKPAETPAEEQKEEGSEPKVTFDPANIDQKSASKATPLYIAVFLHDLIMVIILITFKADKTVECKEDDDPLKLAIRNQTENNQKLNKLKEAGKKVPKENEYDKIVEILNDDEYTEDLDLLKEKYAKEIVEKREIDISSDDEQNEENNEEEDIMEEQEAPKKEKSKKKNKKSNNNSSSDEILKSILNQLTLLTQRVTKIETQISHTPMPQQQFQQAPVQINELNYQKCAGCQNVATTKCQSCNIYYCAKCIGKSNVHHCINH